MRGIVFILTSLLAVASFAGPDYEPTAEQHMVRYFLERSRRDPIGTDRFAARSVTTRLKIEREFSRALTSGLFEELAKEGRLFVLPQALRAVLNNGVEADDIRRLSALVTKIETIRQYPLEVERLAMDVPALWSHLVDTLALEVDLKNEAEIDLFRRALLRVSEPMRGMSYFVVLVRRPELLSRKNIADLFYNVQTFAPEFWFRSVYDSPNVRAALGDPEKGAIRNEHYSRYLATIATVDPDYMRRVQRTTLIRNACSALFEPAP